jgi:hypothetical protein
MDLFKFYKKRYDCNRIGADGTVHYLYRQAKKNQDSFLDCIDIAPMQKILGRYDRVDLPQLGLSDIHAKIDTGAYTSSLHCRSAQVVNGRLQFVLLDEEHPEFTGMIFTSDTFEIRDIRNSFGEVESRYVITTSIRIFDEVIITEFSLSNRGSLRFPILLGRKILRNRYLIDVTRKNVSFREKLRLRKVRKSR